MDSPFYPPSPSSSQNINLAFDIHIMHCLLRSISSLSLLTRIPSSDRLAYTAKINDLEARLHAAEKMLASRNSCSRRLGRLKRWLMCRDTL